MPRGISHILFEESFSISRSSFETQCDARVSFMRYDENGYLFFPIFIFSDEDNDDIYISMIYRLYPDGHISLTRKSGDVDESIEKEITAIIESFCLADRIIDFVSETKYEEFLPAQAC